MDANVPTKQNIKQAVPFFMITDMQRSLKFYVDGIGFELKNSWMPRGIIEWCWLQRDSVSIMLQEYRKDGIHTQRIERKLGEGVAIYFQCEDALKLYHEFSSKGLTLPEPFVGNGMWDVAIKDPDGYSLHFESITNVPEETTFSEWKNRSK